MPAVRLLAYNILLGGRRGRALHDVVRAIGPDVVLVNESPKTPLVWRGRCRRLAVRWGLRYVAGGRVAGSNMVAVGEAVQVETAHTQVLRRRPPRRGLVAAQLHLEGIEFGVVCCHLGLRPPDRAREVEAVIAAAGRLRGTVVVAGDLNEPPGGPSWQRLRDAGFADFGRKRWRTFPAARPRTRIDALLVRGPARVLHHGDPGVPAADLSAASDHRPVLAVLALGEPAGRRPLSRAAGSPAPVSGRAVRGTGRRR